MDPERWERIESVCAEALELDGAEREVFLASACAGDPVLRREVDSLLSRLATGSGFLSRPLVDLTSLVPPGDEPPQDRIGPFRLVRRLGRGGMGEVYLAVRETEELQQQVAIKVIRRDLDTDEVLRRFRLERRILATLHHPNIAQLLDAGATPDGRPYFVMEYVDGEPLDQACDRRQLPVRARIQLFQTICSAVQHAHQNLVVHRDLKPRNILVSADGVPKLLDFGIGKVLVATDALGPAEDTRTDVRALTPEYAAPEQIAGQPVSTATDVHGLGVLLYELLSGQHPYRSRPGIRIEIERAILESNPGRPSEIGITPEDAAHRDTDTGPLRRMLAGDLDTIVLKAIRKEPERRYPSAAALADDLQRHLDGLPVGARPDTLGYRTRKFVHRNAGWVAAAAVAFLALGVTTAVTLVQSRRVAEESRRVTEERDKALEVRSFLMEMFGASGADRTVGDTVTVRRLLDLQAANLDGAYATQSELKADMMEVLADGYDRLGLYHTAEPLAREALELRRTTLPDGHPDLAASLNLYGWVIYELDRLEEAERLLREAVAIRRHLGPSRRRDLSRSLNDLGVVLTAQRRFPESDTVLTEALAIRRAEFGDAHRSVGVTASNLAAVAYRLQRFDDAVALQNTAVQALRRSVGPDHQRTLLALGNLAVFRRVQGDLKGSVADYRDLVERQTRLQGIEHPRTTQVTLHLAMLLRQVGRVEADTAVLVEARGLMQGVTRRFEISLGPSHRDLGTALFQLALAELALGRRAEALDAARRAFTIFRTAQGDTAKATLDARRLMDSLRTQGAPIGVP